MNVAIDRDLVIDLTRELVRIPSVNPPGNEQPAAEYLGRRMQELGMSVDIQQVEPGRANVIGRIHGRGDGHLVLTGHLDVVPPGGQAWERDPFGADLADGKIYGRGSCDMKGGVAAIVAAGAALIESGFQPSADYVVAATCGEEAGMTGARDMVARQSLVGSRYLVVAEPTGLDVFIGEKGVLWVRVRALGQTAHGSMPSLGINAVSYMSRLIPVLEQYPFEFQTSDLLGDPTLSVNTISGGNKTNVVPDLCEIELDMRTVPSQDHKRLMTEIGERATEIARTFHPGLRVEVDLIQEQRPLETEPDHPLVEAMVQTVTVVRGKPRTAGVPFGTDAAQLGPGFSIPMVICGPGQPSMAHQPNEHVEVEQLVQAAEIYAALAQRLTG